MFLERYDTKRKRITVDLENFWSGAVFLIGGSPELLKHPIQKLKRPGIVTMAMNNAACNLLRPTLHMTADKPPCYSMRRLLDPGIVHFARNVFWKQELPDGSWWADTENTYFYPLDESAPDPTDYSKGLVWRKTIFPAAIALCMYLGFRRIYLLGCQFSTEKGDYDTGVTLNENERDWNRRVYGNTVNHMREWLPVLRSAHCPDIISCTNDSPLNDMYEFRRFEEAVDAECARLPVDWELDKVVHSSKLSTMIEVKALPNLEREKSA